eukprot:TRINITY_DN28189_c0_g1_i1.p1 TRINITY_DN28189_c0_g1~~TRINITY_DN28189_c0_g1_i1.p1  ORF type:complete len:167 (+),score=31.51 TRINITY_DN28189_c0_g1_i1:56-556(+)
MKRTLSHEAEAAVQRLRECGFSPANVASLPSHGGMSPLTVLGLGADVHCWQQVRQAYVARIREYPPEQRPEEFVTIVDAYTMLKKHFQNAQEVQAADTNEHTGKRRRRGQVEAPAIETTVTVMDSSGILHAQPGSSPQASQSSMQDCSMDDGLARTTSISGAMCLG